MNTIAAIVPVYNKEPYVAQAINSILSQTRPIDEIIIVDDASTDGSIERVKAFRDPRIKLLRRTDPKERGLPATRNVAVQAATSRWVALLDADDVWHPDYVEEIEKLATAASERTGLLFTGWESIWADGTITRDPYSASVKDQLLAAMDLDQFVATWLRLRSCPVFPSGVVLRRDLLIEAGLFDEACRRGEDKEMWLRMLTIGDALGSARVCSTYFCGIPGQMNTSITTNVRHCLCTTLERLIEQSSGTRRRLLMRLFNLEVYEYARAVAQRQRVSHDVYRGFHVSLDPARYLVVLALAYLPPPVQQMVRRALLLANKMFGVPRTRAQERAAWTAM
jgi:succinoglycan biosynthesis protein ExoO